MPKVFYTEKDIDDMLQSGTLSLELNDNVVLTDLAYERVNRLGLKLVHHAPQNPPAIPPDSTGPRPLESDLPGRIRRAVLARMGNQVDAALLDAIIQRVLASTGMR